MLAFFRASIVITLLAAAIVVAPAAWAQPAAQQKADAARAKALVGEGDKLLKAKKHVAAREKYVEALRLGENDKYNVKVGQVDAEIDKLIKKELEAASTLYAAGKYDQALARLDATLPLREIDASVLYNRALIMHKQGKQVDAVKHLDTAQRIVANDKERMRLSQLKTQWETGETLQPHPPAREEQIKDVNEIFAAGEGGAETCKRLRAMADSLSKSPSLVFNLAKCAEDAGELEEASRLLDRYLTLAPEAVDAGLTKRDLDDVRELESRAGRNIIALYGEADRAARQGQYKRAIESLTRALDASADLPDTHLRLARLHQGAGNSDSARNHYQKFLSLESREVLLPPVRDELAALEQRSAEYQALVGPSSDRLQAWLHRYLVDGRPMGSAASQQELRSIAEQLQKAAVMMPLATDLNRMLGQIHLIDGNYPAARKAFSVVAEAGEPVWFYAIASGVPAWGKNIVAKVELHGPRVRLYGVTRIDKKKYVGLTNTSTPAARLGGFLTPAQSADLPRTAPHFEMAAVSNAETKDDGVELAWTDGKAAKREARLSPIRFTNAAPVTGPAARRFANAYTKLFRDFGDVNVKLGAERLTGGEKFGMAMQVALAAYSGGAMSLASGVQGTANIIAAAMRSAAWATMELQNAMDRQARMFQETQFKIMPIEDPKPAFRKELLR